MELRRVTLEALEIEDRESFRHVALFDELSTALRDARYTFLVPAGGRLSWNRALLVNLAFWSERGDGDVLTEAAIPADVVMHAAWHHLAGKRLAASLEAELLAEAIASAFDLYLVGRLLGHAPDSTFLETQVPAMRDVAEEAGLDDEGFEALLERVAADPDRAFEQLRGLLFDAALELSTIHEPERAIEALSRYDQHVLAPLLHHYELATWILKARAHRADADAKGASEPRGAGADALAVHGELARAPSSVEWLADRRVRSR
jgi:hypothetical protein